MVVKEKKNIMRNPERNQSIHSGKFATETTQLANRFFDMVNFAICVLELANKLLASISKSIRS